MPRWGDQEDDEDDYEYESEEEFDEPDSTIDCPYCGEQIHDDAPWCPHCENYISAEDAPPSQRPWWMVAGVILCLAIVLTWFLAF